MDNQEDKWTTVPITTSYQTLSRLEVVIYALMCETLVQLVNKQVTFVYVGQKKSSSSLPLQTYRHLLVYRQ